ncbi:glycoside hydrolase family 76 protein [Annulohypoxylon maeteangense]|uniref:glycoside hydrolase family 76 protein n=1 Tax=Annulohypoxylon maeteangense TaxID=1927788 RepID=UPI002007ED33|nr:glycoside hydrolase family 76 protein [Annulohypoxylon maeteangense]KAI0880701.1 glycoside hydrolase family 76 protein [Annulohypoxylon maeteangense]
MLPATQRLHLLWLAPAVVLGALEVDLDSPDSIKAAAKQVAYDLMTYYHGNESGHVPGILPGPPPDGDYYWWQGGALWGTMIDYWHYTGDETYNDVTFNAMQFQVGENRDYAPSNWTLSLGNDDQSFWGMSAMLAAEVNFRDAPAGEPQWLALAQGVWNEQAAPDHHDDECGGGLRWQIFSTNKGYDYKNTIANGCFFNIGARLARYTRNETYANWATKTFDWIMGVHYIDKDWNVFDGGHVPYNCTDINRQQYSYNAAILLSGAAYMYDYTNQSKEWEDRITGLLDGMERIFFVNGTLYEPSCEAGVCSTDMLSFKGYVHRWLAVSTQVAPFTKDRITKLLRSSAEMAVKQCTGGANGRQCGFHWTTGVYDGKTGAGQQMNVLGALSSLLVNDAKVPVTNSTGGTSIGDPNAGSNSPSLPEAAPITVGDRAGAGIVTALVLGTISIGAMWMALD